MHQVYAFRYGCPGRDTVMTIAPKDSVLAAFGTHDSVDAMFGGSVTFRNFDTDERWVGVFGARDACRGFRPVAAAGRTNEVVHTAPPVPARLAFGTETGHRPDRGSRMRMEAELLEPPRHRSVRRTVRDLPIPAVARVQPDSGDNSEPLRGTRRPLQSKGRAFDGPPSSLGSARRSGGGGVEFAADPVEHARQAGTKRGGSRDDAHGDKRGDKAVLDRRRARIVAGETRKRVIDVPQVVDALPPSLGRGHMHPRRPTLSSPMKLSRHFALSVSISAAAC